METVVHRVKILVAIVVNGRYFGGGMHITPNAKTDDGMLGIAPSEMFEK